MEGLWLIVIVVFAFGIGMTVAQEKQKGRELAARSIKFNWVLDRCKEMNRVDIAEKIGPLDDAYVLRTLEDVTRVLGVDDRSVTAKVLVDRELGKSEDTIWAEVRGDKWRFEAA